jgi:hypothetical protein
LQLPDGPVFGLERVELSEVIGAGVDHFADSRQNNLGFHVFSGKSVLWPLMWKMWSP